MFLESKHFSRLNVVYDSVMSKEYPNLVSYNRLYFHSQEFTAGTNVFPFFCIQIFLKHQNIPAIIYNSGKI